MYPTVRRNGLASNSDSAASHAPKTSPAASTVFPTGDPARRPSSAPTPTTAAPPAPTSATIQCRPPPSPPPPAPPARTAAPASARRRARLDSRFAGAVAYSSAATSLFSFAALGTAGTLAEQPKGDATPARKQSIGAHGWPGGATPPVVEPP